MLGRSPVRREARAQNGGPAHQRPHQYDNRHGLKCRDRSARWTRSQRVGHRRVRIIQLQSGRTRATIGRH